ncbi:hypothetical protein XH90_00095 [Bradyrhizobium sp. CCBAU 53338]|nr:hypothetical protein XH90_00095 [Bradyrhizobium sp. CCBAU 53338]
MVDSFCVSRLMLAGFGVVVATKANHTLRCHAPRKRGIRYAAAHRFHHNRLGVLDRPVKPGDDSGGCC